MRAAVSIGRRLQDPLAELVKLEPKALGAGPAPPRRAARAPAARGRRRDRGRPSRASGVDLNAASRALLARVPGLDAGPRDGHRRAPRRARTLRLASRARGRRGPHGRRASSRRPAFLRVKGGRARTRRQRGPPGALRGARGAGGATRQGRGRARRAGSGARARGRRARPGARPADARRRGARPRAGGAGPARELRALCVSRRRPIDRPAEAGHGVPRAS